MLTQTRYSPYNKLSSRFSQTIIQQALESGTNIMQINVSQLLKEPIGSTRTCQVKEATDVTGSEGTIQGEVKLTRTDRGILTAGTLHMEIKLFCSRCLGSFSCPITLNIEDEYLPTADIVSGTPLTLPEESASFTINEHHILDLAEAIRQYTLVTVPMKPLCGENCAGLCPICGHNLNQGACDCPPQKIDPRWSKLRTLTLASNGVTLNHDQGRE